MKKTIAFLLSACFLLLSGTAKSQETIYLFDGTSHPFRLIEGDENVVKMAEMKGSRTIKRSLQRESVALVFNSKGAYLFVSEMSSNPEELQTQLELFYEMPPYKSGDILIKANPLQVITGNIQYESPQVINYQTTSGGSGSVKKEELAAVIRSDGRHELIASPETAAHILSDALAELSKPDTMPTEQVSEPVPGSNNLVSTPVAENTASRESSYNNPQSGLDAATLSLFRDKGLQKVEEFIQYLNIITDKGIPSGEKDKAIEQTLSLFLPSATIQVTSVNRPGIRTYKIRDYLVRLKLLPYTSTEIAWHEVNYIKELTQAEDGAYYGLISGRQTFTGYGKTGENVVYDDMTKKEVKVKLQQYSKNVEGAGQLNWEVLLGNIGVSVAQ